MRVDRIGRPAPTVDSPYINPPFGHELETMVWYNESSDEVAFLLGVTILIPILRIWPYMAGTASLPVESIKIPGASGWPDRTEMTDGISRG